MAITTPGAGWLGPLGVTVVAGLLRFWRLGEPRAFVFDETYYAKDAWALLQFGHERATLPAKDADPAILAGNTDVFSTAPAYVVHPPAGKWVIAAGEQIFGLTPFGWRFSVAVLGTLSVLMVARIGVRLTGSAVLGSTAGLLLALDGLHFVQSRTALLDTVLMAFVLAAFGCLLIDRGRRHAGGSRARPWRLLAGVILGLACGTKWSGLWFVMAFGLLAWSWDWGAQRAAGEERSFRRALRRDAPPAVATLVLLPALVYLATWSGWLLTDGGWDRAYAADRGWPPLLAPLVSLAHYHASIYGFHTGLDSFHPYRSSPWGWTVLARPVSFFYETPEPGGAGCAADRCAQEVLALGTPALWWAGTAALLVCAWLWLGRRDWRGGAVLSGVAAGWLPWFLYQERTIFSFYAIVFAPFMALAVTLALGLVLGPAGATAYRRGIGAAVAGTYVAAVTVNFGWLLPVYAAEILPYEEWFRRMWFPSWV